MITLMTPLRLAALIHPDRTAVMADGDRLTYKVFYRKAKHLAQIMQADYGLRSKMKVGILCRNHLVSALLIPALSRLGVHVRLLNTDIPASRMKDLLTGHYQLLIYDEEVRERCLPEPIPCPSVTAEALGEMLQQSRIPDVRLPFFHSYAKISVLTGGSSGRYKTASRPMGVVQYLSPFWALLSQIRIHRRQSVLIALPFYHGFGLSTLIVSLLLGKKICLLRHFECDKVFQLIQSEQIDVLPVVPAMLSRLWQHTEAEKSLQSLKCVLCGGDRLDSSVAGLTQNKLGPVLYNLYGTSEAGFLMLAKPEDLCKENIIGRPLLGVGCEIRNLDQRGVGELWVRTRWAMSGRKNHWQNTGDLVSRDSDGCYYHHGRADRMAVCGGENVSLDSVEHILCSHPAVSNALAYTVSNPDFGQVLHAKVELSSQLTEDSLYQWLQSRLTRAEMPHQISFGAIELLSTGKRNLNC